MRKADFKMGYMPLPNPCSGRDDLILYVEDKGGRGISVLYGPLGEIKSLHTKESRTPFPYVQKRPYSDDRNLYFNYQNMAIEVEEFERFYTHINNSIHGEAIVVVPEFLRPPEFSLN